MSAFEAVEVIEDGGEEGETLEAWATLIRTGVVWSLQGFYGRQARDLILGRVISPAGEILNANP